ncbi:hypothetical protein [Rubinisphaera italica]|uniref:Uncharacterized protein n=1 Tax=Rubinisphaera italica TaxID=2527969 RepID=A0A5C5XJH3_9PLAN|nr:hypothetical protein [Rubinisphaera italica]TWT62878.1 hypothetical protein Pan54_36240 [Rubinisphaera italica]
MKVNYYTVDEINNLITSFQRTLQNLFLSNEITLDVEIKGSVTSDKSGSLAQLPCRSDWWSWERLAEFENCKPINSLQLQGNVNRIEKQLSPEVISKTKEVKAGIEQQWSEQEELLGEYAHLEFSKQELNLEATIVKPQIKKPVFQPEHENLISTFSYPVLDWHPDEPDAFERTRKVLLPFFRSFFREHRREPSVKEGISYLKQNGLYSGAWEDGQSERNRRVSNVLKFISASFDPKKLRSSTDCKINHGLIRWVRKHFPKGIKGSLQDKRVLDFLTKTCGENNFHVPTNFVIHFVQLLNLWHRNPDDNDGLATSFFKENWNRFDSTTYSAPSWNQDFFRVTREHFNSTGIVDIYDRQHKAGKCWRWKKGENFPQKYRTKKVMNVTGNGRWRYLKQKRNTTVQYLYGNGWIKNLFQSKTTFCEMICGRSPP